MPNPIKMPRFAISFLVVAFGLATTARAQETTPSPSPSPSPTASQPTDVDRDVDVHADIHVDIDDEKIQAEVERATAEVHRAMEHTQRDIERQVEHQVTMQRDQIQREAERAAKSLAKASMTGEARSKMSADVRIATEEAMRDSELERDAAVREAMQDAQQTQHEKEQEARDRAREKAQEARDRAREAAQEQRERERERRDAGNDKQKAESERVDELYDQAMESIDEEDWNDALRPLSKLLALNTRVDAALYWTAYSQAKMNKAAVALTSLARLQKDFPVSRWTKEGRALELEVRGKSGQTPRPEQEEDLDMKLMAVSALAQSDPQEAMPILSKLLASTTSPRKIRERTLFVLAQMGSPQASSAIADVARGNSSPELQRKAVQYLGVFGGPNNRRILSDVYGTTNDVALRKEILNSFMVSGDKARVLAAAKTEQNPTLRADAVRLLGVMGGTVELSQMYTTATTTEEKKTILHALFLGGAVEPMAAAARGEKDKEVRLSAVRNLGLMGRRSQDVLGELYKSETDPEVKKELLNAFFLQNNAPRLVEIARVEKDPGLKKEAVHWLSLMNSKESRAYMIELLKD